MMVRVEACRPKMKFPLFAWAIMLFQKMLPWKKDSFSHMAISYYYNGQRLVIDSTAGGVKTSYYSDFCRKYKIVKTRELEFLDEVPTSHFREWAATHLGKGYDYLQLWGLAAKFLGFISFNTIGKDHHRLICNELCLLLLMRFYRVEVKDTDNWGLVKTWEKVVECSKQN